MTQAYRRDYPKFDPLVVQLSVSTTQLAELSSSSGLKYDFALADWQDWAGHDR